jgi:hypothetical protein
MLNSIFRFLEFTGTKNKVKLTNHTSMEENITSEDLERVKLLDVVAKKGLGELTLDQLKCLQKLVAKKDYNHSKKANKSKMKLLARINVAIYETEEGRQGI